MKLQKKCEHTEQVALMNWCKIMECRHPQLRLIFSIPNGGNRHIVTAKKLRAEGVKPGVPDIFLPIPRNEKHGLFIEMKFEKNKTSENQQRWLMDLDAENYQASVCYGFDEARETIIKYLGLEME